MLKFVDNIGFCYQYTDTSLNFNYYLFAKMTGVDMALQLYQSIKQILEALCEQATNK